MNTFAQLLALMGGLKLRNTILQFLNDSNKWYVSTVNGKVQKLPYKVELTMQDVELWRIRRHITNSVIPDDWLNIDYSKGLASVYKGILHKTTKNGLPTY